MVSMFMHLKLKLVILNLLLNMLSVILVNLLWLNLVFLTMMVNMLHFGMIDMKITKELKKLFMLMILLKDFLFTSMISTLMLLDIMGFMLKNINSLINLSTCLSHMSLNLESNLKTGDVALNYISNMTLLFALVGTLFALTILLKNRIILHEVIILKIKRPTYTEFICTRCKCHEKIPTKIVLQMDMMDPGDPSYPPMFDCEKCGGLMKPVYFVGYTGIEYTYDEN